MPRPRANLFYLTVFLSQLGGLRLASHFVSPGPGHPSDHSDYVLEDEDDFPVRHIVDANFDEDNITFALHHKKGHSIMAILEDEGDCIYSGYMVGCPTSTALVTGCKGEMQGVQIQSKIFGDMIFDLQDGVVMPVKKRYKRSLDPDIDYDYDDSLDYPEFDEEFADMDNAEAEYFPPPPPKLVLNLNVYLDKEWSAAFGRNGVSIAKKILTQAKLLWAHDSLSTKLEFLFEDDKFRESPKHLLINRGNLRRELPSLLNGPDKTPSGEKIVHLYLTHQEPNEKTYTFGLVLENGMCGPKEKARVMILFHNSELVTAMTVAHEIGHLMGMDHDFIPGRRNHKCVSGKDGDTVMAYGDARQKFSTCSNEDFKLYYDRVVLEKVEFCLQAQSTDCSCNGISDPILAGGKCTSGGKGLWCFVNQNTGCKTERLNGKFVSTDPCKSKPCACSGETDIIGGGLCGAWCYVAEEASCADVQPYDGKFFSRAACGTRRTTRPPPTRRTTRQTTRQTTRRPTQNSAQTSSDDVCYYRCKPNGSCVVKYTGPLRSGKTSGSCFPRSFGGSCSGTPRECHECNNVLTCLE